MAIRAKHKRQLSLLELTPKELLTQVLFDDWYYDLPDEEAYNAQRKRDGLFQITDADTAAEQQTLENGTARKS